MDIKTMRMQEAIVDMNVRISALEKEMRVMHRIINTKQVVIDKKKQRSFW